MRYRSNFLTHVIVRADFDPVAELGGHVRPTLSQRIGDLFPVVETKPTSEVRLVVGPGGPQMTNETVGAVFEHRRGDAPLPLVALARDNLSIEYGAAYADFGQLRGELAQILNWLAELHGAATSIKRLGMRYINEIVFPTGHALDWDGLINPSLIDSVKAGVLENMRIKRSTRSFEVLNDDFAMHIHYGLFNPDYPSPLVRRHFVLDIDAYSERRMAVPEALSCFDALNSACDESFESSIARGLRDHMGAVNDQV